MCLSLKDASYKQDVRFGYLENFLKLTPHSHQGAQPGSAKPQQAPNAGPL